MKIYGIQQKQFYEGNLEQSMPISGNKKKLQINLILHQRNQENNRQNPKFEEGKKSKISAETNEIGAKGKKPRKDD